MDDTLELDDLFDRSLKSCTASSSEEAAEVFMLCWKFLLNSDTGKPVFLAMNIDDLFEYRYRLLIRTASHFGFEPKAIAVLLDFPAEPNWE